MLMLGLIVAGLLPAAARQRVSLSADGREGKRLLFRGRWELAAQAFQRAVDGGHPSPAELEGLGYASLKAKRYATAAKAYQRLTEQFPDRSAFWVNLGLADGYQEPPRLSEAEAAFRRAREIHPRDPDALINLAVILHKNGRAAEALPLAQQAADAEPRKAYILAELGEKKSNRILVGFAAETENLIDYAKRKLESKNCDMVVANLVSMNGTGFESDDNEVTLVMRSGTALPIAKASKTEVARRILDEIVRLRK